MSIIATSPDNGTSAVIVYNKIIYFSAISLASRNVDVPKSDFSLFSELNDLDESLPGRVGVDCMLLETKAFLKIKNTI